MSRIFPDYTYSDAPRAGCWWDKTADEVERAPLNGDRTVEVAIIGAGFTGLSAALHLAEQGVEAAVLDSRFVGWGASGRNGGFCCSGGAMLDDAVLERRFGADGRDAWARTEVAAIDLVEEIIGTYGIDADRHSEGETVLAHRARDMADLRQKAEVIFRRDGLKTTVIEKGLLAEHGMAGPFHGAMTIQKGFGLNPRKYVNGLATAAENAGASIYHDSTVNRMEHCAGGWRLECARGVVTARNVIIATNGYSSEHLPPWLADRYLPAQSSVIVTRPLTPDEIAAQGWSSDQMAYDTRNLLHYFRLMPDRRVLFGMRGAIQSNAASEARAIARARHDFETMFPAWRKVETPYGWSGMVSIARNQMPFVGAVPGQDGLFAGLCYHGNGVAMGTYAGALLADLVRGKRPARLYPPAIQRPLSRFGLGRFRRMIMPPMYLAQAFKDRWPG